MCACMCLGDRAHASVCLCRYMYAQRTDVDIGISLDGCPLYFGSWSLAGPRDHSYVWFSLFRAMSCLHILSVGVRGRLPCSPGICVKSQD